MVSFDSIKINNSISQGLEKYNTSTADGRNLRRALELIDYEKNTNGNTASNANNLLDWGFQVLIDLLGKNTVEEMADESDDIMAVFEAFNNKE